MRELGVNVFESDLKRIEIEVIARQKNGKYMKFYRPLDAVVITNMYKEEYINYWARQYYNEPEKREIIEKACIDKFENGLTDTETMAELIRNSKDREQEKKEYLKLLGVV